MSDSPIIEARLSVLEHKLSEVQSRLQESESTTPFKIEAGKVSIEEAPIKNAAISAASDARIKANREAIIENAIKNQAIISTGYCNESPNQDASDGVPVDAVSITLRKHDGSIALRLKSFF
ncbi:hypothetical protein AAH678_16270 [Sodalis endosymbiont of Spalangia cameroni]|uniref:hypothetical protein n=1 Tax=Sodalis praecaptivus TaxID=1239307 RepID=UPI0031F7FC27